MTSNTSITRGQNGFSLVEALMVVSIVALIAAVAVPSLIGSKDAADKAAVIATLRSMHSDQTAFHTANARFARLSELNEHAGGYYGTMTGTTLRRKDWIFLISPAPTDSTLATQYQIIAFKMRDLRMSPAFTVAQDGVIETLVP